MEKKGRRGRSAGGGKAVQSRVDEEMWRRIDPARGGVDESQYSNRRLEDEIRSEVDRDASLLKAFAKLEERRPKGEGT